MAVSEIRAARKEDAKVLAELVHYASEGMALYLWENMTESGQTGWDVGYFRAARETGSFSYRNAMLIEHDSSVAGCLIGYSIAKEPQEIDPETPAMFRPLMELENLALDTWYVNVLAVLPPSRGLGLGTQLLDLADRTGRQHGCSGMSIIVADRNEGARRLYERHGYRDRATRPIVKDGWVTDNDNWILLTKAL